MKGMPFILLKTPNVGLTVFQLMIDNAFKIVIGFKI